MPKIKLKKVNKPLYININQGYTRGKLRRKLKGREKMETQHEVSVLIMNGQDEILTTASLNLYNENGEVYDTRAVEVLTTYAELINYAFTAHEVNEFGFTTEYYSFTQGDYFINFQIDTAD